MHVPYLKVLHISKLKIGVSVANWLREAEWPLLE
jgi:hypothetical protein